MKRLFALLALGAISLAALPASSVRAQDIPTFAEFDYNIANAPGSTFGMSNNNQNPGGSLSATSTGTPNGAPITFTFAPSPFLVNGALANQTVTATLKWTGTTATSTANLNGTIIEQSFNMQPLSMIEIISTQAGPGGINVGDVLLKVQFSGGLLTGRNGSNSASFLASEAAEQLTFFAPTGLFDFSKVFGQENLGISYTGIQRPPGNTELPTGGLRINSTNNLVRSFIASGANGSFAAAFVPEPGTLAMVGLGLIGVPALAVIRRRRAAR